jgi:hypothetical protein
MTLSTVEFEPREGLRAACDCGPVRRAIRRTVANLDGCLQQ